MPAIVTPLMEDIRAKRAARHAPRSIVCIVLCCVVVYRAVLVFVVVLRTIHYYY